MQTVSALYRRLLADSEHVKEVKVKIAGVEYGEDRIFSCEIIDDLLPEAAIGNCISHEIDLTVEADGSIPKMARIEVFFRLTAGGEASEWVPGGVFFVDTRKENGGLLVLHGFDAMLKAEEVWWDPSEDAGQWPMGQRAAADDIARRMGTAIDPRSRISAALKAEYPNDLTMREALGNIAASNAGNWAMAGNGMLMLTPLGGIPPETRFLVENGSGGAILFGSVRILV